MTRRLSLSRPPPCQPALPPPCPPRPASDANNMTRNENRNRGEALRCNCIRKRIESPRRTLRGRQFETLWNGTKLCERTGKRIILFSHCLLKARLPPVARCSVSPGAAGFSGPAPGITLNPNYTGSADGAHNTTVQFIFRHLPLTA